MFGAEEAVTEPTDEVVQEENLTAEETTPAEESPTTEEPTQPTREEAMVMEATQTAEQAAQMAVQREDAYQQAMEQVQALQQRQAELEQTIAQMSQQREEAIVEEMTGPPTFDASSLAFADPTTIAEAQNKYAQELYNYQRGEIMKELQPYLDYARDGMREKERQTSLAELASYPELKGMEDLLPQVEQIIANNKWLAADDMPMREKLINAYAIARGVNDINRPPAEPPAEPTAEELFETYKNNPALQELIEKHRIEELKKDGQQVPPLSASSGAANIALNIPEKPKTFEDASARTREMFGFR
jgi:hypothetical protein